jgi:hypothetical protein
VGLPFDAQLEACLPYVIIEQERVTNAGAARVARSGMGSGNGDFSVGLAKTVLREKNWWPDLIARATWNTPNGQALDNDVALGSGFNQITGQVTAIKRQDPLAFVASASYQKTLNQVRGIEPGDEAEFFLGAFLATSPNTSKRLSTIRLSKEIKSRNRIRSTVRSIWVFLPSSRATCFCNWWAG